MQSDCWDSSPTWQNSDYEIPGMSPAPGLCMLEYLQRSSTLGKRKNRCCGQTNLFGAGPDSLQAVPLKPRAATNDSTGQGVLVWKVPRWEAILGPQGALLAGWCRSCSRRPNNCKLFPGYHVCPLGLHSLCARPDCPNTASGWTAFRSSST